MRHHHEEGRGPRGRHGDLATRRPWPPRRRTSPAFLAGHGELRLIILDILSRSASSHGYELIKEIETLTQGNWPQPGGDLSDAGSAPGPGLISVEDDNGRKKMLISEEGKQLHAENREHLAHIRERLQARMVGCERCAAIRR